MRFITLNHGLIYILRNGVFDESHNITLNLNIIDLYLQRQFDSCDCCGL